MLAYQEIGMPEEVDKKSSDINSFAQRRILKRWWEVGERQMITAGLLWRTI